MCHDKWPWLKSPCFTTPTVLQSIVAVQSRYSIANAPSLSRTAKSHNRRKGQTQATEVTSPGGGKTRIAYRADKRGGLSTRLFELMRRRLRHYRLNIGNTLDWNSGTGREIADPSRSLQGREIYLRSGTSGACGILRHSL